MIARRYDKAFFLRATNDSILYDLFNVTETPTAILMRDFEEEKVVFKKEWNAMNLERWIV
jgi:hypothetical protein